MSNPLNYFKSPNLVKSSSRFTLPRLLRLFESCKIHRFTNVAKTMIPNSTLTRKTIKDMNPNRIRILIDMFISHAYSILPWLVSKHATTLVVIPMKSPPCTSIEPRFNEMLLCPRASKLASTTHVSHNKSQNTRIPLYLLKDSIFI